MRRILVLRSIGVLVVSIVSTSVLAASLADQKGRWSCIPDTVSAPQLEIDFDDAEYRRCDQNICSAYDLRSNEANIRATDATVEIVFADQALFVATRDGSRFIETITRGAHEYVSQGSCRFQS